ncbi:unnamed protein product [Darwinula stevensoni]|uniref:Uncharacterized protein n=1 Tax=Darwinula stevensoni TaxID=69355 RepID=A0A7R8X019_9CRUS|nr:unnamed protein product [Darwinula stevensoni]CAG0880730.1 unnamed protein product [Darwinula stevensoni]
MRGSTNRRGAVEEALPATPQGTPGSSATKKRRGREGKAHECIPVSESKKRGERPIAKADGGSSSQPSEAGEVISALISTNELVMLESQHISQPASTVGTRSSRGKRGRVNASAATEIAEAGSSQAKRRNQKRAADVSESPVADVEQSKTSTIPEFTPVSEPVERVRTRGKADCAIVAESSDVGQEASALIISRKPHRRPHRMVSADTPLAAPSQEKTRTRGERGHLKTSGTEETAEAGSSQGRSTRRKKIIDLSEKHEKKIVGSQVTEISETTPVSELPKRGGRTGRKAADLVIVESSETVERALEFLKNKRPLHFQLVDTPLATPSQDTSEQERGRTTVSDAGDDEEPLSTGKQQSCIDQTTSAFPENRIEYTEASQTRKGERAPRKVEREAAGDKGDNDVFPTRNSTRKKATCSTPKAHKGRITRVCRAGQVAEEGKSSPQQQGKAVTRRGREMKAVEKP